MTDTEPVEDEFAPVTEDGIEQCPWCGHEFYPPTNERVVTEDGTEHEHLADTDPAKKAYCRSCWRERQAVVHAQEHATLDTFSGSGGEQA